MTTSHPRWRAWLSEGARHELEQAAAAVHPSETGGILVGVHTAGSRPWMVRAIEIPSRNSGNSHYVVPPHRRRQVVQRLRREHDARLGYLGEWHSHPLDVAASATDLDSIRAIAGDPVAGCTRPVLLVARRFGGGYTLDARQVDRRALRPLDLIAAGPLPPPVEARTKKRTRRRLLSTVGRRR